MPTNRRRRTRTRRVITFESLSVPAKLALLVAWHPPRNDFERARPATFSDYAEVLATYRAVRGEFIERYGGESFAEALDAAQRARPDADIEALGRAVYTERFGEAGLLRA